MASLHWVDYLIFVLFLVVSLGIGVYHSLTGGRQSTVVEFVLADRKLSLLPTMLSWLASFYSALTVLGGTAELYNWGIQQWLVFAVMNTLSILLAERLVVPLLYPLKLTSSFQVWNSFYR